MIRRGLVLSILVMALMSCGLTARIGPEAEATPGATPPPARATSEMAGPSTPVPTSTNRPATMVAVGPTIPPQPTIDATVSAPIRERDTLIVELYRRVTPAVVSIEVTTNFASDLPNEHPPLPFQPRSQGSGFLYDGAGHIVTNNHVIANAEDLQVTFYDGSSSRAEVVGSDDGSDLAVIRVERLAPGAAPLPIGDSQNIAVGQTAIAIGNPFGLQNTLTVGVISGLSRSLLGPASGPSNFSIPNIIQTDAAINPGNSGGPLLNINGEVIGVNTAISSENGGFAGVGYAVPSSAVSRIVPVLIAEGKFEHPYVGIRMYAIDALMAREFNLNVESGVLVVEVQPDSPAETAGLRAGNRETLYNGVPLTLGGDIITAINGQHVANGTDLISFLALETDVGETITLTIIRNGREQEVALTLNARPGQ